jgi:lipoprotein-releasing system permease protein
MNLEYFISKRIIKGNKSNRFSQPIIRIAILAIALGIIVMTISLSIVGGFQEEIRNKIIGFGSHIQITSYDSHNTYEASPIDKNQDFYPHLDTVNGIKHIQIFATKAGIIKTNEEIYGVVVKGIGSDFDWEFFNQKMVEGTSFTIEDGKTNNAILLSKTIANKMKLNVNDKMFIYFIQEDGQLRPKDFLVSGIYQSGLEQFDNLMVITNIAHIQKLDDYIYNNIGYALHSKTIKEQNPDIFNWLDLQDLNVIIIIILMVIVAVINIISALLILILERTGTIGILKALGMPNWNVRWIFIYNAIHLIVRGLFWGNLIGIGLCLLQLKFGFIKLPEESYYVSEVPIKLEIINIILLNIGTLVICVLMLIIPSYVITKISPIKAIRFD